METGDLQPRACSQVPGAWGVVWRNATKGPRSERQVSSSTEMSFPGPVDGALDLGTGPATRCVIFRQE
jgi:hypothetical protein